MRALNRCCFVETSMVNHMSEIDIGCRDSGCLELQRPKRS